MQQEGSLPNSRSESSATHDLSSSTNNMNVITSKNDEITSTTLKTSNIIPSDLQTAHGGELGLEKARKSFYNDEADSVYSPCTPSPQYDTEYDSEEDSEVGGSSSSRGARIGPSHQADLTGLYGSEICADEPELLWDPDTMGEDALDVLLAQCRVNDSTYKQMSGLRSSATTTSAVAPSSPSATSTTTTRPSSPVPSDNGDAGLKILDFWSMLQLVHKCGYKSETVLETLKSQGLFGWCTLKTAFTPWREEEKQSFETIFGALLSPKHFDQVSAHVGTRTVGECIEYYYGWKHSERCKAWKKSELAAERSATGYTLDDPVPLSRMLPSSTTRKRKREVDTSAPLDSSERMYLEALDYFQKTAENPELMLNIVLDTPNFLGQDLHPNVPGLHHESAPNSLDVVEPVSAEIAASASSLAPSVDPADVSIACDTSGHYEQHAPLAGVENIPSSIPRLSNAAASPKRMKLAEVDDHHAALHQSMHGVPLSASTGSLAGSHFDLSASATIDPLNMFFSPPEPTMDIFMHF